MRATVDLDRLLGLSCVGELKAESVGPYASVGVEGVVVPEGVSEGSSKGRRGFGLRIGRSSDIAVLEYFEWL